MSYKLIQITIPRGSTAHETHNARAAFEKECTVTQKRGGRFLGNVAVAFNSRDHMTLTQAVHFPDKTGAKPLYDPEQTQ